MKVVIMAGGYATRLWPITKTKAKPLLPIGKKKIIDFIYEKIKKFGPVIVSTNRRFEYEFRKWAEGKDVELFIEESMREEEKLGAVRALAEVASTIRNEMLVVAGDNLFSFDLDDFVEFYKRVGKPVTALYDVGDYELAKRYGVAELNDLRVVKFVEKPADPPSTLVGIGIYAFPSYVCGMLSEYVGDERADNLGDFIGWLCQRDELYGYAFQGNWYDIGSPDSYLSALRLFMEHSVEAEEIDKIAKIIEPVTIEKGAKIVGRSIIGPYAYIGRDCLIENSDVCDSVLFDNVVLRRTKVWRSIVDEKCEIRNIELSASIVGAHAKIQRGD